ncbi:hypothetical protein [Streptomyces albidochromogenes]|uniref:Peptidase inhibitor family I36 protein n=1 Tax=Streptomyces albidochromogenes TaxID=329524 RepID=A0ABW6FID3_9ACTN
MRKTTTALAALGVAILGITVPVGTAQAATACDNAWHALPAGMMGAYEHADCGGGFLGRTAGADSNWRNDLGAFQGADNDKASSVLNAGTTDSDYTVVQFFNDAGTTGGYSCLKRGEFYASNLTNDYFTSGHVVNDNISSHRWVREQDCGRFMT